MVLWLKPWESKSLPGLPSAFVENFLVTSSNLKSRSRKGRLFLWAHTPPAARRCSRRSSLSHVRWTYSCCAPLLTRSFPRKRESRYIDFMQWEYRLPAELALFVKTYERRRKSCSICKKKFYHSPDDEDWPAYNAVGLCGECVEKVYAIYYGSGSGDYLEFNPPRERARQRKPISRQMFTRVLAKSEYKCVFCGLTSLEDLVVDHIKPFSRGGECSFENYQILCKKCNLKKRNRLP
jgi:hypothetical protein